MECPEHRPADDGHAGLAFSKVPPVHDRCRALSRFPCLVVGAGCNRCPSYIVVSGSCHCSGLSASCTANVTCQGPSFPLFLLHARPPPVRCDLSQFVFPSPLHASDPCCRRAGRRGRNAIRRVRGMSLFFGPRVSTDRMGVERESAGMMCECRRSGEVRSR